MPKDLVVHLAYDPHTDTCWTQIFDLGTKQNMTLLDYTERYPEIDLSKALVWVRIKDRDGTWS